jgi:hypothetical protein
MKASRFGAADDRLSRLASELAREAKAEKEAYQDLRAFYAPGECYHDIARASGRRVADICARHGFTSICRALEAIESRTSEKWVHFNIASLGLGTALLEEL